MNELQEGQKLHCIFWAEASITVTDEQRDEGMELMVVMQPGEYAMLPWIKYIDHVGRVFLYNARMIEGCQLHEDGT